MNTIDRIESLFEKGCTGLTIGRPPQPGPAFFVQAGQAVARGEAGHHIQCSHQAAGDSIADCLNKLAESVEAVLALKIEPSGLIKLRGNGR